MAFLPKFEDLVHYQSLCVNEFVQMPKTRLRGKKTELNADEMAALARLRAALCLLNKLGAIDKRWLEKQNLVEDFPNGKPDEKE